MSFIRSERKCIEILRILKEHQEPVGAKRLSELMTEHGFALTDRAVQYYLSYLDNMGFTRKIGNQGRILTPLGVSETERALVDERIGFIISKLERLAFKSNFNPETGTGNVAYNLSYVPENQIENLSSVFDEVIKNGISFFKSYKIIDSDPRIPSGHLGVITVCSITMDGVLQNHGIPVKMAFGGLLNVENNTPSGFQDLIGYKGTTIDPLLLFINAGFTSIGSVLKNGTGKVLANVREVPDTAIDSVNDIANMMKSSGFLFPVKVGTGILNIRADPYRTSIVAYSGMNLIGYAIEKGINLKTEIGAGNIPYSSFDM
ncbi:NrpR regulatory domain-containing protein [Methanomicrobium antiquum]|uniref:NrpR regulatory domain-containing protein n=1 Tax=Methanomicrobium antiquum TaxID=487686 RepID=A0AAF0JL45_9EURY|nr:NrpR regulatory domain-containing protein [Methanomicrobium antiquum]WFN35757.1 NrpR regulatory domain-containing protein [Methanomicrobium antiquum]